MKISCYIKDTKEKETNKKCLKFSKYKKGKRANAKIKDAERFGKVP